MTYLKSCVFVITVLLAVSYTTAQNNNNTGEVTDNVDPDEKSSLEKGMEPIFSLYHNFLGTVMKKSFYDADTPFNVQKLNELIEEKKYGQLQSDWQDLVKTYGGIAACVIMGLLFMVFMPLVGCIYCCCHCCCHKCGGTQEKMDPKRAACMRITFASLLLICATMVLVGCIITFLGSELLKRSLKDEDNQGLISSMDTNLGVLQVFADNTIKDVQHEARQQIIVEGLGQILPQIEGAVNDTVSSIKNAVNATAVLEKADELGQAAKAAVEDIEVIQAALTNLTTLQNDTHTKLYGVQNDIDTECAKVTSGSRPPLCADTSRLTFTPNFIGLNLLHDELTHAQGAKDIDTYVQQAKDQFNTVSSSVDSAVSSSLQSAKTEIKNIETNVNRSVGDLSGQAEPFQVNINGVPIVAPDMLIKIGVVNGIGSLLHPVLHICNETVRSKPTLVDSIQEGRDYVKGQKEEFEKIGNYVWYACIGLGCAVLIVVFFYYMGVLFGLCGERPNFNANCCNRGTGANLLCAGICFSFLFAALLMLVVILMFTLGGLGYTMACRYLNDGIENVDTFETVLSDGLKMNISKSFGVKNLTIAGMFRNCKNDEGIYTALHLSSIFNVDTAFNVTDVQRQVQEMADQHITIANISLLSNDLRNQLNSLKDTRLSQVDFTQYTEQLDKPLTPFNIDQTIAELRTASAVSPALNATANELQDLKDVQLAQINQDKAILEERVESLKKHANVTAEVDSLIDSIQAAEVTFNTQKDIITKEQLQEAVNNILLLINTTVTSTTEAIKHTIGQCKPLYDAAQNVADTVCIATLDPFNAIWFGLGWSLFFYIPCIVFAAVLSSLYQRTEKYSAKDKFDDMNLGYAGYGGGRNEDALPLTSTGGGDRRDRSNGNYNQGYDTREPVPESRFHRDGNYPNDHGRGNASSGHVYDAPITAPRGRNQPKDRDSPPHYDEAVGKGYGGGGGGYPKANRY